jgi:Tfp pilus assembly protein PilO
MRKILFSILIIILVTGIVFWFFLLSENKKIENFFSREKGE